jgi:hypothetical protein
MERGSFFYAADGGLRIRPAGGVAHDASGGEWREAGLALNPNLDNPTSARLAPLYHSHLLVPPDER